MHEMLLVFKKSYIGKAKLDIEEKYIGINHYCITKMENC